MVELMIVLVIIAILAAFLTPTVKRYMDRAQAQEAARDVGNTLRMARNKAMSRGEVILAQINPSTEGGSVTLSRTDTSGNSSYNCDPNDPGDSDCFAISCAEVAGMNASDREEVAELELSASSPDMMILDMDPDPDDEDGDAESNTLCFSPNGRVLSTVGLPVGANQGGTCDEMAVRVWVRRKDPETDSETELKNNPLGSPALDACPQNEEEFEIQRQGRQVANFWAIEVPYNGSISVEQ